MRRLLCCCLVCHVLSCSGVQSEVASVLLRIQCREFWSLVLTRHEELDQWQCVSSSSLSAQAVLALTVLRPKLLNGDAVRRGSNGSLTEIAGRRFRSEGHAG